MKYKMKGEHMKLEIEMNEIDLDMILDVVLKNAKEVKLEKRKRNNEETLKKSDEMMFGIMEMVNKDLPLDKKYELINLLLQWFSENGVINSALKAIAQEQGGLGEKLRKLNLSVDKISLEV